jgi:hypothetical protein
MAGACARYESAQRMSGASRVWKSVSCVRWCEACCDCRTPGLLRILHRLRHPNAERDIVVMVAVDPFAEAETRYRTLVEERRAGALQPRAYRLAVRDLAVLDSEGRRWMLGPEDGIWYRREHERWLQADPPRRLVCNNCGHHNLGRHSFCVECGHRLDR